MEGAASRLSLASHVRLPLGAASRRAETSCAIPAFSAGRGPPHPTPIHGLSTIARVRSPVPLLASSPSGSKCSALFRPLLSGGKNEQLKVRASSIPESAGESSFVSAAAKTSPERGDTIHALYFGVLFALWYMLNVYFYIYNKQVWKIYPYPMITTAAHLAMGTAFILFGWMSNLMKRPKISSQGLNFNDIYARSLLAGVCFHAYQQVSYMILEYVYHPPVIVASLLFFRTPFSPINAHGTGVALGGVFSYSPE